MTDLLGVGLTGTSLTDLERRILRDSTPYAIVLFGRNIEGVEQLRELIREVKSLAAVPPLFMIDEEGGRVDRLRNLVPGMPSAESFSTAERAEEMAGWFGRVMGESLRFFDIEVDLAPVVDVRGEVATKGLERRTFGSDVETVIALAGAFMRGLHASGVAASLKHYPGIGRGSADPHYGATVIDLPLDELQRRELAPFARLGNEARCIMIGHGTYPHLDAAGLPATFSHRITTELLRGTVGFDGLAVSDDMEMHAVSDLGSYEEISERALMAGNDIILFCSHIERVPDLQRYFATRSDAAVRARIEQAGERAVTFRNHCETLRAAAPPVATFELLMRDVNEFLDELRRTRPGAEVYVPEAKTKGGRTGREEWT